MNIKLSIIVIATLIVSIFINVALGFNVSSKIKENEKYEEQNKVLEKKVTKLEKGLDKAEGVIVDEELAGKESVKRLVETFFKTQYEYTSSNYKERFEKIKQYVSTDVYGQLTAAGIPDIPTVKFENKIKNMKVYLTSENKQISGLVLLDTVYEIDSLNGQPTKQIFEITVSNEKGKIQIDKLEVLGTFTSMAES